MIIPRSWSGSSWSSWSSSDSSSSSSHSSGDDKDNNDDDDDDDDGDQRAKTSIDVQSSSEAKTTTTTAITSSVATLQSTTSSSSSSTSASSITAASTSPQPSLSSLVSPSSTTLPSSNSPSLSSSFTSISSSTVLSVTTSTAVTTSVSAPSVSSTSSSSISSGWIYYACLEDINGAPALDTTYATSDVLTPAQCVSACGEQGYHYAGLERGNECFCGSSLSSPLLSFNSTSSCTSACTGESASICGGEGYMSLFYLEGYRPASSSGTIASSTMTTVQVAIPSYTSMDIAGVPNLHLTNVILGKTLASSAYEQADLSVASRAIATSLLIFWVWR